MPGMTRPGAARPQEDPLFGRPRQAAVITAVVLALTAAAFAVAAGHGTMARIQRADDAWLRLMISGRTPALTVMARVFNVLGLVYVTLPVRIALAGYLARRRRWWHLAAFAAAIVLSEVADRPAEGQLRPGRPPGSLVATSGASFPSGHAIAASVTVLAAVIALVPAGRRRARWAGAAVAFSILMGLSRAYLAAHWLSDATAGILLGSSCALLTALITGLLQRQHRYGWRPPGDHAPRPSASRAPGHGTATDLNRNRPARTGSRPHGRAQPSRKRSHAMAMDWHDTLMGAVLVISAGLTLAHTRVASRTLLSLTLAGVAGTFVIGALLFFHLA